MSNIRPSANSPFANIAAAINAQQTTPILTQQQLQEKQNKLNSAVKKAGELTSKFFQSGQNADTDEVKIKFFNLASSAAKANQKAINEFIEFFEDRIQKDTVLLNNLGYANRQHKPAIQAQIDNIKSSIYKLKIAHARAEHDWIITSNNVVHLMYSPIKESIQKHFLSSEMPSSGSENDSIKKTSFSARLAKCSEEFFKSYKPCSALHRALYAASDKFLKLDKNIKSTFREEEIAFLENLKEMVRAQVCNETVITENLRIGGTKIHINPTNANTDRALASLVFQLNEKNCLLLGSFAEFSDSRKRDQLPAHKEKLALLESLIEQYEQTKTNAKWMLDFCTNNNVSEHNRAQITNLITHAENIIASIQFELDATKNELVDQLVKPEEVAIITEQKPQSASQLPPDFLPAHILKMQEQKPRQITSKKAAKAARLQAEKESKQCVIETEFDGKLIGTRKGDFVIIEDIQQNKTAYHLENDMWVRHDDDLTDVEAGLSELELDSNDENKRLKILEKKWGNLSRSEIKINTLCEDAQQYLHTCQFLEKQESPFSQYEEIERLAIRHYERAATLLNAKIQSIDSTIGTALDSSNEFNAQFSARKNEFVQQLGTLQNQITELRNNRVENLKKQEPSDIVLKSLLQENQIENVRKTLNRKELQPQISTSGIQKDYLDEYQIEIKDVTTPFILHSHFRTRNAALGDCKKAHLKFTDQNNEEIRNGVRIELLRKIDALQ